MPLEIERRFLVPDVGDRLHGVLDNEHISQAYLVDSGGWIIRIREVIAFNDRTRHYLTMKRPASGFANYEVETEISERTYRDMAYHTDQAVHKQRHRLPHGDVVLEIDTFKHPRLVGLVIAEVELPSEDHPFAVPDWFGREITGVRAYSNFSLAQALRDPPAGPYAEAHGLIPPPPPARPLHLAQVVTKI